MGKYDLHFTILMMIFFGGFLLFLFIALSTPGVSYWTISVTIIFVSMMWLRDRRDWSPLYKPPVFIAVKGGVVGRATSSAIRIPGNRLRYWVSIRSDYVMDHKKETDNFIDYIKARITGNRVVCVDDYDYKFKVLNSGEGEAPEGTILYSGFLNHVDLENISKTQFKQEETDTEIAIANTRAQRAQSVSEQEAKKSSADKTESMKQLVEVVEPLAKALKENREERK